MSKPVLGVPRVSIAATLPAIGFCLLLCPPGHADDWTNPDPLNPPAARAGHSLHALPDGEVILFGGGDQTGTLYNDLYSFRDNEWSPVATSGDRPPARQYHASWMDDYTLYVHGGYGAGGATFTDLWRADLSSPGTSFWNEVEADTPPAPRRFHAAVPAPNGNVYFFGGINTSYVLLQDLWQRSSGGEWQPLADAPEAFMGQALFMPGYTTLVAVGNSGSIASYDIPSDTWSLATGGPPVQHGAAYVVAPADDGQQKLVTFGGHGSGLQKTDTVYEYLLPSGPLTERAERMPQALTQARAACFHRSTTSVDVVIFGGYSTANEAQSTTYVYSTPAPPVRDWVGGYPTNDPIGGRGGHSLTRVGSRVVLFGGRDSSGTPSHNTFMYSVTTGWSEVTTTDPLPDARTEHAAWSQGDSLYIHGGTGEDDAVLEDVWQMDFYPGTTMTCSRVSTTTPLGPRTGHTATPLSNGDVYFLGGFNGAQILRDLWSRTPSGTWQQHTDSPWQFVNHAAQSTADDREIIALGFEKAARFLVADNAWTQSMDGVPIFYNAASAIAHTGIQGETVYVFGGTDSGGQASDRVYEYATDTGIVTERAERMPAAAFHPAVALLPRTTTTVDFVQYGGYDSSGHIQAATRVFSLPAQPRPVPLSHETAGSGHSLVIPTEPGYQYAVQETPYLTVTTGVDVVWTPRRRYTGTGHSIIHTMPTSMPRQTYVRIRTKRP